MRLNYTDNTGTGILVPVEDNDRLKLWLVIKKGKAAIIDSIECESIIHPSFNAY